MAIFTANLPTLVPPNFCTSHLDDGSMLFWCKLGGVHGGEEESEEEHEEALEEDPDIFEAQQRKSRVIYMRQRVRRARGDRLD